MSAIGEVLHDLKDAPNLRVRWKIIEDLARRKLVARFRTKRLIYKAGTAAYKPVSAKLPLTFKRCTNAAEVPDAIWDASGHYNKALLPAGGVIWVVFVGDKPAAFMWMRAADHIPHWFVPLQPGDIVLFAAGTLREFRGLGIHRALMHHIVVTDGQKGTVWCDAHEWNVTAQRSFEKAGFQYIVTMPHPAWKVNLDPVQARHP